MPKRSLDHLNFTPLILASLCIHGIAFYILHIYTLSHDTSRNVPVKIRVIERQDKSTEPAPDPTPAPQVPPKPKLPTPAKKPEQRQTSKTPPASAPKVQGLTADSVSDQGTLSAPLGNSLMIEDKGKRLTPEEIASLKKDLSAPPLLVATTYQKPPYTDAALAANLEGRFKIEVFVDEKGKVQSAELKKKIGFGMDERIVAATMSATFIPAKNEKGVPYAAWGEVTISLELE